MGLERRLSAARGGLACAIAAAVGLLFLAPAIQAQENVLVNKPGVMKRATRAKDEENKKFKLRKGERVLVIYERGPWYWVKSKNGRQGWVKKKYVRFGRAAAKPKPEPKAKPVKELLPQEEAGEEETADDAAAGEEETAAPPKPGTRAPAPATRRPGDSGATVKQVADRAPAADAAPGQLKLAVMDLRGTENLSEKLLGFLTNVVAETLDGLGAFKAISSQDIAQMLAYEANKQLLGCDDVSCLAEIGGALGADYLVSGSVSQVDNLYVVQLQLFNINEAKVEARASREHQGEPAALFGAVRTATKLLVREILRRKSGTLQLAASEEGATVKIDDAIVGTTPLAPIEVAGGMHTVSVEKEGFVVYLQDVEIQEKRTLELDAKLLPSEEYRREFRGRAQAVRTVAMVTAALGALALTGGGLLLVDYTTNRMPAMDDEIAAYNALQDRPEDQYNEIKAGMKQMAVLEITYLGLLGAGLVAGAVGVTMFFLGDDPDRYE